MPLPLRLVVGTLLVLAGVALVVVAARAARGRLRRNPWAGVRTRATMRSDAAFEAGNRAAAAPTGAAGAVGAVAGAVLLAAGDAALSWVVLVVGVLGLVVLAGVGGLVGDRVAAATARPAPVPSACAGACAGCDLVAGCRPAAEGAPEGAATSPRSPDRP